MGIRREWEEISSLMQEKDWEGMHALNVRLQETSNFFVNEEGRIEMKRAIYQENTDVNKDMDLESNTEEVNYHNVDIDQEQELEQEQEEGTKDDDITSKEVK